MPNIRSTEHHQFYGVDDTGASLSTLATDQSGNANFSTGASWIHRGSFARGEPCTVMIDCSIDFRNDPAGYIFSRYSGTTRMGLRYNGVFSIQIVADNAVVETLSLTGTSGPMRFVVHWSMDRDPVADDGSMRSQIRFWRQSTGALLNGADLTHAAPAAAGSDIIFGAQVTGGSNSAGAVFYACGYLNHAIAPLQTFRDMLTAAAAPTITGSLAMEVPVPDFASGFGDQDTAAGPTHWLAAGAVEQNQLLQVSPLVNQQWDSPADLAWPGITTDAWWVVSPDGDTYFGLPYVWRRPVPKTVNYVQPRVFIQVGGTTGTVTVDVKAWSANRNPGIDSVEPLVTYSATETIGPTNDITGAVDGRWLTFSPVRISRDESGLWSWFALSLDFINFTGVEPRAEIRAVSFEPISDTDSDANAGVGFG